MKYKLAKHNLIVKGILGPYQCRLYKNLGGKNFLLLGEFHDALAYEENLKVFDEGTSPIVTEWLYNVIMTSEKCVDIFLETPVKISKEELGEYKNHLMTLISLRAMQYDVCDKSKCINQNIRFHQADLRMLKGHGYKDIGEIIFQRNIDYMINYYLEENCEFNIFKLMDIGSPSYRSEKELTTIMPKKIFCEKKKLIQKQLAKLEPSTISKFKASLKKSLKSLNSIGDIAMDIYQITRMFVKWDEKMSRMPSTSRCKDVNSPKNIIVYAGAYHTSLIECFLKNYFGKVKSDKALKIKYGNKAIDMNGDPNALPIVKFKEYFNIFDYFD